MTERRLRIAYVAVQPVLVWDDGDQLTPGPEMQGLQLPLTRARQLLDELPQHVADLATRIPPDTGATDGDGDPPGGDAP